jgi:hypothetical protein
LELLLVIPWRVLSFATSFVFFIFQRNGGLSLCDVLKVQF